jgi:hypothetical protein
MEHRFAVTRWRAGFYGIEILKRDSAPWRTVEGIEFRSITVRAFKGKQGACVDCNQAVIYRGEQDLKGLCNVHRLPSWPIFSVSLASALTLRRIRSLRSQELRSACSAPLRNPRREALPGTRPWRGRLRQKGKCPLSS